MIKIYTINNEQMYSSVKQDFTSSCHFNESSWIFFRLSKIGKENGMTANEIGSHAEERLKRLEEGNEIIQRLIFKYKCLVFHICWFMNEWIN